MQCINCGVYVCVYFHKAQRYYRRRRNDKTRGVHSVMFYV